MEVRSHIPILTEEPSVSNEVSKPHSQSAASIFRVQQSSLQLGYRQIARNMVMQTHSRGRKIQVWYRLTWKKRGKCEKNESERMAVSLEAHSILRQQLLCIILGFTICLFPFFHTTYIFLEQLWNRFHFLHHILLGLPSPLLSIVWGVHWLGYSCAVGRDFFLQTWRWALRPTQPPIQQKPGAHFPQKSSQVIKILTHLPLNAEIENVSTLPCFHGKALN